MEYIYHYTSVEALASILHTGKLRFTRLDYVDDLEEAQEHSGIRFGMHNYASCWTTEQEESIPLWKMYGDGLSGVRIRIPKFPFKKIEADIPESWKNFQKEGSFKAYLSFEDIFGSNYMITNATFDANYLGNHVRYVDSVNHEVEQKVKKTRNSDGTYSINIEGMFDIPFLKNKHWAFQKEYRFVLMTMPFDANSYHTIGDGSYNQVIAECYKNLFNSFENGRKYIDIVVPSFCKIIQITKGPNLKDGKSHLLDLLIEKYDLFNQIEESVLQNKLR